mmetsp:Transcript_65368/g.142476  ORF Transcript_65368/g.142476 Transcript_65368/m.142476 type:complete len:387 (-) Transcript_65368:57-1217(-)
MVREKRDPSPDSLVAALSRGEAEDRAKAAAAVEALTANAVGREAVFVAGVVPPLVEMLSGGATLQIRILAASALANLARAQAPQRAAILAAGPLPALVALLECAQLEGKEYATQTLHALTVAGEKACLAMVTVGAVPPLVRIIRDRLARARTIAMAAGALAKMSCTDIGTAQIVSEGAIPLFIDLVQPGRVPEGRRSSAQVRSRGNEEEGQALGQAMGALALAAIASRGIEQQVSIFTAGAFPPLVALLGQGSPEGRTQAAVALAALSDSPELADDIVEEGALHPLFSLINEGNDEGKTQAAALMVKLTENKPHCQAVVSNGALLPLLEMLAQGSPMGKANAAGVLRNIAMDVDQRAPLDALVPIAAKRIPGGAQILRDALELYCL